MANSKIIVIEGAQGAGKTTIINLILGFYKVNSGNILFDGKNMDDISLESIRKNVFGKYGRNRMGGIDEQRNNTKG